MICYIKDFKDFRTIAKYDAVSYSLADGEDGSVTIYDKDPVKLTTKYVGCWLIIGDGKEDTSNLQYSYYTSVDENGGVILDISGGNLGTYEKLLPSGGIEYKINALDHSKKQYVYYISGCSPENNSLNLTIKNPIYAFDRPVLYDGSKEYGVLISNILINNFGNNCPDKEYTMDYMDVVNTDRTSCKIETDSYGYIIPSEIFENARKEGVVINFKNTSLNRLAVEIYTSNYDKGIVVFGDGHSQLESESYDSSYCAKVTILHQLIEEHLVLCQSEVFNGVNGITYYIEIAEEILETKQRNNIMLSARMHIEWPSTGAVTEPDRYSNNRFDLWYGENTHGTQLLSVVPVWDRTPEAGSYNTEWFKLSAIPNQVSCKIYGVVRADGNNGTNKYPLFTLDDLIPSTDIKVGPVKEDSSESHGIYFRGIDYYLNSDGSITRTPPSGTRPKGLWNVYTANSNESPMYVAIGAFSGNSDNHKVEFYSDKYFEYYQPMKLRLRGEVLETIITSRTITNNDDRYFYKCGNLLTTLTDHVQGIEKAIHKQ